MSAPTWITDLEDEAGGKPVLLVEGDIDERVLAYLLLYEHSFPAKLDREPVTDRAEIRQILEGWHAQLDPDLILEDYDRELAAAQTLSAEEQLKTYVHGKKFFSRVVVRTLNRLFPQNQQGSGKWQEDLTRTPAAGLPLPADLKDFLADVVELFTGNSQ